VESVFDVLLGADVRVHEITSSPAAYEGRERDEFDTYNAIGAYAMGRSWIEFELKESSLVERWVHNHVHDAPYALAEHGTSTSKEECSDAASVKLLHV